MNSAEWQRLSQAFDALCDLPADERRARLEVLAAQDPALGAELRAMLAADGTGNGALVGGPLALQEGGDGEGETAGPASWELAARALAAGERLGPWRVIEPLGAGGMGEVWAAERADGAFERRVAVKLLRRGLETDTLLRRFVLERQILARLVHPGIARLLDAGSTPDGRPYFVLERVDGEPITSWARSRGLDLEARLRLLLATCAAVDFAHRNLVVHRDLKPSNVLVTQAGEVKLLDFGIAKLLEPEAGTHVTAIEGRALTLAYAAPEQIRGEPVTTSTDVYSLGVLLYELLTGQLPHRRERRPLAQLAAVLERETVERPSLTVARQEPRVQAKRLARRLGGDLDTIVLMALAHEPARRYPSAAALADDLDRHLNGRPISARPDTAGYRLGKFVRRHRLAVGAAALLVLSLVGGLAGTTWQARRSSANAERAELVKRFLVDVFRESDPSRALGRELTAREVLEQGSKRIEAELASDPALAADLDEALAEIHRSLGLLDRASLLAERALATRQGRLPADPARLAQAQRILGEVRLSQARPLESAALLEPAAAALARGFGPDSLEVARVELPLASAIYENERERGLALLRHALAVHEARLGRDHLETVLARLALADMLDNLSLFLEAEPVYREAVAGLQRALGPLDPRVAEAKANFADLLDGLSRPAEAEPLLREAIDAQRQVLGPRHPDLGNSLLDLSILLNQSGRHREAQAALEEALGAWAAPSMDRAHGLRDLGSTLVLQRRFEEGARLYEESIPLFRQFAGERSPELWRAIAFLGDARMKQGRLDEAERYLRLAVERLEDTAGKDSYQIRMPLRLLAETRRRAGGVPEAIAILRRVRALELKLFGTEDHRDVAVTDRRLGIALTDFGGAEALAEARLALDRAVALDRKYRAGLAGLGESLLASAKVRRQVGEDPATVRAELEEAQQLFDAKLAADDPLRLEAAAELARRDPR